MAITIVLSAVLIAPFTAVGNSAEGNVDPRDVKVAVEFITRAEGPQTTKPISIPYSNGTIRVSSGQIKVIVDTVTHRVVDYYRPPGAYLEGPEKAMAIDLTAKWLAKMGIPTVSKPEYRLGNGNVSVVYTRKAFGYSLPGRVETILNGKGKVVRFHGDALSYTAEKPQIKVDAATAEKLARTYINSSYHTSPVSVTALNLEFSEVRANSELSKARRVRLAHKVGFDLGAHAGNLLIDAETGKVLWAGMFR